MMVCGIAMPLKIAYFLYGWQPEIWIYLIDIVRKCIQHLGISNQSDDDDGGGERLSIEAVCFVPDSLGYIFNSAVFMFSMFGYILRYA